MLVDTVLPARSVVVPLNVWLAPSVVTLMVAGQLAVPESASVQAKVTVAGSLTTPCTGAGLTVAVTAGFVLSMFSVTEAEAWLPFASAAVPVMTWFAPSVVMVAGPGHCTGGTPPEQV